MVALTGKWLSCFPFFTTKKSDFVEIEDGGPTGLVRTAQPMRGSTSALDIEFCSQHDLEAQYGQRADAVLVLSSVHIPSGSAADHPSADFKTEPVYCNLAAVKMLRSQTTPQSSGDGSDAISAAVLESLQSAEPALLQVAKEHLARVASCDPAGALTLHWNADGKRSRNSGASRNVPLGANLAHMGKMHGWDAGVSTAAAAALKVASGPATNSDLSVLHSTPILATSPNAAPVNITADENRCFWHHAAIEPIMYGAGGLTFLNTTRNFPSATACGFRQQPRRRSLLSRVTIGHAITRSENVEAAPAITTAASPSAIDAAAATRHNWSPAVIIILYGLPPLPPRQLSCELQSPQFKSQLRTSQKQQQQQTSSSMDDSLHERLFVTAQPPHHAARGASNVPQEVYTGLRTPSATTQAALRVPGFLSSTSVKVTDATFERSSSRSGLFQSTHALGSQQPQNEQLPRIPQSTSFEADVGGHSDLRAMECARRSVPIGGALPHAVAEWFKAHEGIALAGLTPIVTAVGSMDGRTVLYQNTPSISYYGLRVSDSPAACQASGWQTACEEAATAAAECSAYAQPHDATLSPGKWPLGGFPVAICGESVLAEMFCLEPSKLERMQQEVCVEGRVWRGIVQVPSTCNSSLSRLKLSEDRCAGGRTVSILSPTAWASNSQGPTPRMPPAAAAASSATAGFCPLRAQLPTRQMAVTSPAQQTSDSNVDGLAGASAPPLQASPKALRARTLTLGLESTATSGEGIHTVLVQTSDLQSMVDYGAQQNALAAITSDADPLATSTWGLMIDISEQQQWLLDASRRDCVNSGRRSTATAAAADSVTGAGPAFQQPPSSGLVRSITTASTFSGTADSPGHRLLSPAKPRRLPSKASSAIQRERRDRPIGTDASSGGLRARKTPQVASAVGTSIASSVNAAGTTWKCGGGNKLGDQELSSPPQLPPPDLNLCFGSNDAVRKGTCDCDALDSGGGRGGGSGPTTAPTATAAAGLVGRTSSLVDMRVLRAMRSAYGTQQPLRLHSSRIDHGGGNEDVSTRSVPRIITFASKLRSTPSTAQMALQAAMASSVPNTDSAPSQSVTSPGAVAVPAAQSACTSPQTAVFDLLSSDVITGLHRSRSQIMGSDVLGSAVPANATLLPEHKPNSLRAVPSDVTAAASVVAAAATTAGTATGANNDCAVVSKSSAGGRASRHRILTAVRLLTGRSFGLKRASTQGPSELEGSPAEGFSPSPPRLLAQTAALTSASGPVAAALPSSTSRQLLTSPAAEVKSTADPSVSTTAGGELKMEGRTGGGSGGHALVRRLVAAGDRAPPAGADHLVRRHPPPGPGSSCADPRDPWVPLSAATSNASNGQTVHGVGGAECVISSTMMFGTASNSNTVDEPDAGACGKQRRPLASASTTTTTEAGTCWHEVSASRTAHPVTGQYAIVITQTDVTAKVEAEKHLAFVTEAEHRLLEQIFPRHILAYMTEEGGPWSARPQQPDIDAINLQSRLRDINKLATSHNQVTLLFADIQGFTPMCKVLEPRVVMAFLNDLFTRFDRRLDEFGVYKVETIGDCYFVAGGLITEDADGMPAVRSLDCPADPRHAERVFRFAQAMMEDAACVALPTTGGPVKIRIGIHSGPVVSGVVGTRMPRFCLFGDTVNTASRMESTGVPGSIHVSETTARLLHGEELIPTGGIEVKGKGLMKTFLWGRPDDGSMARVSAPQQKHLQQAAAGAAGCANNNIVDVDGGVSAPSHGDDCGGDGGNGHFISGCGRGVVGLGGDDGGGVVDAAGVSAAAGDLVQLQVDVNNTSQRDAATTASLLADVASASRLWCLLQQQREQHQQQQQQQTQMQTSMLLSPVPKGTSKDGGSSGCTAADPLAGMAVSAVTMKQAMKRAGAENSGGRGLGDGGDKSSSRLGSAGAVANSAGGFAHLCMWPSMAGGGGSSRKVVQHEMDDSVQDLADLLLP